MPVRQTHTFIRVPSTAGDRMRTVVVSVLLSVIFGSAAALAHREVRDAVTPGDCAASAGRAGRFGRALGQRYEHGAAATQDPCRLCSDGSRWVWIPARKYRNRDGGRISRM